MNQHPLRTGLVAVTLMTAMGGTAHATELEPLLTYTGDQLFQRFCAACHGVLGHGDGPVSSSLDVAIPDLTQIARRHGGKFPADWVVEVVDGRAAIPAHGTRPMPVWGYEFEAQAPENQPGRAAAQSLIDRLVDYLRSIQR